jgi:hypothetical protein
MIELLLTLIVLLLIFGVAWWVLTLIPLPQPLALVIQVVLGLILLVVLIAWLLPAVRVGGPLLR